MEIIQVQYLSAFVFSVSMLYFRWIIEVHTSEYHTHLAHVDHQRNMPEHVPRDLLEGMRIPPNPAIRFKIINANKNVLCFRKAFKYLDMNAF